MKSNLLLFFFAFLCSNLIYSQSTITSTATGGNWGDTLTWVGHQIPTEEDNVIISGPVYLYNLSNGAKCNNLTINNELTGSYLLDIHGTLENNGLIKFYADNLYFFISIYGDLINNGDWEVHNSTVVNFKSEDSTNPQSHNISCPNGEYISANRIVVYNENKIITTSDLYLKNTQILYDREDFEYLDFKLLDYSSATFSNCDLQDINFDGVEVVLNLNENTLLEHSIVANSITTYTNKAEIYGVEFTSDSPVINNDSLRIWGSIYNPTTVYQDFENYGVVTQLSNFFLKQDLISKNQFLGLVYLSGDSTQKVWLDDIFEGTLIGSGIIEETAIFSNAYLSGNFTIPENAVIEFTNNTVVGDTLNGSPYASYITSDTTVTFERAILNNLILKGTTNFNYSNDNELNGVVKNVGKIMGPFTSNGLLINEGDILPYTVYINGDFVNYGTMTEDETYWTSFNFTGTTTQHIDLRNNSLLPHYNIRFHPDMEGTNYTWYKDDIVQGYERELYFDSLLIDDAGTYYCIVDEQRSRDIIVGSDIVSDVEEECIEAKINTPSGFILEQNYPNPFNPNTTINYKIPAKNKVFTSPTTLIVYDLLGKKIQTLVNEQQSPGNYSVTFTASSLPSGVYFYRLQSGEYSATKKLMLIK